jgi:hypothetical protein
LVDDPFPTPYSELKNYDGSTGSGKSAAEIGWPVFMLILVIVFLIVGVSAGVTIKIQRG